jgi:hypothetical protein
MRRCERMTLVYVVMAIVAGLTLIAQWEGRRVAWRGAGVGAVVGFVMALIEGDPGLLALSFAVGTFAATGFELIGRLAKRLRNG